MLKTAVDRVSRGVNVEILSLESPIGSLPNQAWEPLKTKERTMPEDNFEILLEQARALLK